METGTVKELARFIQTETESKEEPKATLLSETRGENSGSISNGTSNDEYSKAYFNGRMIRLNWRTIMPITILRWSSHMKSVILKEALHRCWSGHEVLRSIFLKNGTQKILADVPEYKVDITIAEDGTGVCGKE